MFLWKNNTIKKYNYQFSKKKRKNYKNFKEKKSQVLKKLMIIKELTLKIKKVGKLLSSWPIKP